jgi:uncharacterized membrane protein YcaP (DUF421 family)
MSSIEEIFGVGKDLTTAQISARAFVMFFIALLLIRLGGVRIFAKKSSFDNIIVFMLGAILSRGVVGANTFWSTVAASAVMIAVHRFIAWVCIKNKNIEKLLKGEPVILYKDGKLYHKNLQKTSMSESDLMESLRLETKKNSFSDIDTAFLEKQWPY